MKRIDYNGLHNTQITIVGNDKTRISAEKVESLVAFDGDAAYMLYTEALNDGRFVKLVTDSRLIKTLVIMDSGRIYPSTFKIKALAGRIRRAMAEDDETQLSE